MLRLLVTLVLVSPAAANAHAFGQPYQLPMPYWMYIYAVIGALVLSFLIVGWFVSVGKAGRPTATLAFGEARWVEWCRALQLPMLAKAASVFILLFCIVTGLWGSSDPNRNINMTMFWMIFVLGFSYFTALVGDCYQVFSPWRVLTGLLGDRYNSGCFRYPQWLGYWPAVLLYMVFIWLELLGHVGPYSLAVLLLSYTVMNFLGVLLVGSKDWFRYCEFFAVFLRLLGKVAPLAYEPDKTGNDRLRLRWPFAGLLEEPAEHFSLLVFLLFMLSSTAFDGIRETAVWFKLFWHDSTGLIAPMIGEPPITASTWLRPWYVAYETVWMVLSPFLYLAVFVLTLWLGKVLIRGRHSVAELSSRFAFTLLPIVLVYHVTHYYTLLLNQGFKMRALVSDPFGWGWNLFGTTFTHRNGIILDMGLVWNTQLWLILVGHIVSVYLAHVVAIQMFEKRSTAVINQLPMLLLMVLFTAAGLWILAQPLQGR